MDPCLVCKISQSAFRGVYAPCAPCHHGHIMWMDPVNRWRMNGSNHGRFRAGKDGSTAGGITQTRAQLPDHRHPVGCQLADRLPVESDGTSADNHDDDQRRVGSDPGGRDRKISENPVLKMERKIEHLFWCIYAIPPTSYMGRSETALKTAHGAFWAMPKTPIS